MLAFLALEMKRSPIRRVSKKRRKLNEVYNEKAKEYLEEHIVREVCLQVEATQIHHKARRLHYLCETRYFLAVCYGCHRWIEDHPAAAMKAGWTLDKFNPENK